MGKIGCGTNPRKRQREVTGQRPVREVAEQRRRKRGCGTKFRERERGCGTKPRERGCGTKPREREVTGLSPEREREVAGQNAVVGQNPQKTVVAGRNPTQKRLRDNAKRREVAGRTERDRNKSPDRERESSSREREARDETRGERARVAPEAQAPNPRFKCLKSIWM